MTENENAAFLGKKIFFLHPPVVIQNQVVVELAQEEFEVYVAKEQTRLREVLKKYPESVVFACINEGMRENEWEDWVRGVMVNQETSAVRVGVIASGLNENSKRKYVMQLKVPGGYTVLKSNINDVIKQLVSVLNNMNAKGRRKYIRALTDTETNTTINLPMNGTFLNGKIKDISVVGFSCTFDEDPNLVKNSLFSDIQIRLQTQLLKTEGIIFGSRMDGDGKTYVILFTQRMDPDVKTRIRKYIQINLQGKMDRELGML